MTFEEFDNQWYGKRVRIITDYFKSPNGNSMKGWEGYVSAALYDYTPGEVILAVVFDGYEPGYYPEKWVTFKLSHELSELANFEILE